MAVEDDPSRPSVRLVLALEVGGRVARFDVREFTPFSLIVEIRGGSAGGSTGAAIGWTSATLEILRAPGSRSIGFPCEIEFADWLAVSGNVDGPKLSAARLRLACAPELRAALTRLYRRRLCPALREPGPALREPGPALREPGPAPCEPDLTLREPANLPPELGVDVAYVARDGASLAQIRVARGYSKTWLVHPLDLTCEPEEHDERDACQAALYQHFATTPVLLDGHQQQWLIGYFDRRDPWNQLFFDQFVDWYDEREKATVVGFERYEVGDPLPLTDDEARTIEVDQVQPAELDRAVALIRAQLPEIACAAFDIEAARLDRVYLHPDYANHALARGRRVFVVRDAGELVGVALCETSSLDTNLVQLFARAGASTIAKRALIGFVRKHYLALGHPCPALLTPAGGSFSTSLVTGFTGGGLSSPTPVGCMIWSGQTLRAYRTFLRTAFARVVDSPRKRRRHADAGPKSIAEEPRSPASGFADEALLRSAETLARLRSHPRLASLLTGNPPYGELLGFLLYCFAFGVRMAESGRQLERSRVLLDDLFELGQRWRDQFGLRINVELLLQQPPPRSLLRWSELASRRSSSRSAGPRAGLVADAIELEVARIWAQLGPILVDRLERQEGATPAPEGLQATRSLTRWLTLASADIRSASLRDGFTAAAARFAEDPELEAAVSGSCEVAIHAHLDVLGDCVELGRELAERVRLARRRVAS